ncbi:hypothetical protein ADL22_12035 [Streptomyces sp. NRRL F-4489]|uniref:DoxX family membrane protein n=1 Tax=Streptomyces sp. NRRL F-4489 TaxID=1609095 RepID=UPI000747D916|nr:DoxX family membrane protein [Streptomyces sp. NRRL F-4489]KUL45577.1 hypothetical protein ADL22_12035 [Streptomyces sp. NRRL F-4489]
MAHAYRIRPPDVGDGRTGGFRGRLSRHALLPLRLFLGGTFLYAGLQKLTDPAFPAASGHGSLGELLRQARDTAAVPQLVELAQRSPVAVAYALAGAGALVGLGTLAGLLGRAAALGGTLIALTLWLTVSRPATPYHYGSDLAYLLAWSPLLLAGAPRLSLDAALFHRRRRHDARLPN